MLTATKVNITNIIETSVAHVITSVPTSNIRYTSLSDLVDQMFPPLRCGDQTDKELRSEFNTFEYWRDSLPEIEDTDELLSTLKNSINSKLNMNKDSIRKKVK